MAKYLYDRKIVQKKDMTLEAGGCVRRLHLYTSGGEVSTVSVDMGEVMFAPSVVPVTLDGESVVDREAEIGGEKVRITCLSVGNPHCVVFVDSVEHVDIENVGPMFENAPFFPERVNTEFVHAVNRRTLRMRTYERGNGETSACGTGACAAAAAAVACGYCPDGEDITVKTRGGDLTVRMENGHAILTGDAQFVFCGSVKY